ncbi:MAG: class I SAM-dependent methyltransferase [Anaerolineae bacterium]
MAQNKNGNGDQAPLPSTLYTEEYFRTACEGFEEFNTSEGAHLSRRLNDAFKIAEIETGMKVLDVGCGRGEILRHCMRLGIESYGMDYAEVATRMTRDVIQNEIDARTAGSPEIVAGACRSDAKKLPFPSKYFDRVLMFDVVEHLHPWELLEAMLEVRRVLKDDGMFVVHTAPNKAYDQYAYPIVRMVRTLMGQGENYPKDPRAITPVNQHVHVNEQDLWSMERALNEAGFDANVWLDSPPQNRQENALMAGLRKLAFDVPPFRWFFEREVFAVAKKQKNG